MALAQRLAELCDRHHVEYVLTQDFAAQQYAPFLSSLSRVACRMVPGMGAGEVMTQLDAQLVIQHHPHRPARTSRRNPVQSKRALCLVRHRSTFSISCAAKAARATWPNT